LRQIVFLKSELNFHLGLAAKSLQDILQAIKSFKEALNFVDVSNKELFLQIQYEIGVCYEETNQKVKAAEAFNHCINTLKKFSKWNSDQCFWALRAFYFLGLFSKEFGDLKLSKILVGFAIIFAENRDEELLGKLNGFLKSLVVKTPKTKKLFYPFYAILIKFLIKFKN